MCQTNLVGFSLDTSQRSTNVADLEGSRLTKLPVEKRKKQLDDVRHCANWTQPRVIITYAWQLLKY